MKFIIQPYPGNSNQTVVASFEHAMKMLAVNTALLPTFEVMPGKNFYKALFETAKGILVMHFCVMSTETKDILDWDSQFILEAVESLNVEQNIGKLLVLEHTGDGQLIFDGIGHQPVAA